MNREETGETPARLVIESRMEELARVAAWAERAAAGSELPAAIGFAIQLCLEEALSNVIRHGYRGRPDCTIAVEWAREPAAIRLTIEDRAPVFNPLGVAEPAKPASIEELRPGGQGIALMRRLASDVEWEEAGMGNRLTLRFQVERQTD